MEKNLNTIENLLKSARSVDSKEVTIDEGFKNTLREKLYNFYLNSQTKGGSIMAKLKNMPLNLKVAIFSFAILFVVAAAIGGGALLLFSGNQQEEAKKEVLLAANLAFTDGSVSLRKSNDERWVEALQGDVLSQGDSLKTGVNSRAVLELDSGDAVRLNASSEVRFESMAPSAVVVVQVRGESYARVAASEENTFTMKGLEVEAQAVGTAYMFNLDVAKEEVTVYVYDSKVKVSAGSDEKEVPELKKAVVEKEKKIKVSSMNKKEYQDEFAEWNMEKDEEGGDKFDTAAPVITITSPKGGTSTEAAAIAVKGKVTDASAVNKINVNGKVYSSKQEGKGYNPQDGTFDVDVSLEAGENTIRVAAWDIYWNESAKTVKVTRTVEEEESGYWSVVNVRIPFNQEGHIDVAWDVTSGMPTMFKVFLQSTEYPEDNDERFKENTDVRGVEFPGLHGGSTYTVKVCAYVEGVGCISYGNVVSFVVNGPTGE